MLALGLVLGLDDLQRLDFVCGQESDALANGFLYAAEHAIAVTAMDKAITIVLLLFMQPLG